MSIIPPPQHVIIHERVGRNCSKCPQWMTAFKISNFDCPFPSTFYTFWLVDTNNADLWLGERGRGAHKTVMDVVIKNFSFWTLGYCYIYTVAMPVCYFYCWSETKLLEPSQTLSSGTTKEREASQSTTFQTFSSLTNLTFHQKNPSTLPALMWQQPWLRSTPALSLPGKDHSIGLSN